HQAKGGFGRTLVVPSSPVPERVCPKCSSEYVKRVSRIGPERLMSLFYIYPFRCHPVRAPIQTPPMGRHIHENPAGPAHQTEAMKAAVAKVYIVSFRTHDDRRPSKFIVLLKEFLTRCLISHTL